MGDFIAAGGHFMEAEYAMKAANYNADINRRNADLAREKAAQDARQVNVQGRKHLGEMRALYGSSGVTQEGSVYDVLQESARAVKADELNVKYRGELEYQSYQSQAQMDIFKGKASKTLSQIQGTASLVNGGVKAYMMGA